MNDLQEQIIEEEHIGFKVTDLGTATWAMKKIAAHRANIDEIENVAKEEIKIIRDWSIKEMHRHLDSVDYLESLLVEFLKNQREVDSKAKVNTPYGRVRSRTGKKYTYSDKDIIEWAKVNNQPYINVVESVNKVAIKKAFPDGVNKETGEIIPGIEVEEKTTYSIVLKGEK